MRGVFNVALLVCTTILLVVAVMVFGGVLLPYAAPLYLTGAALALLWAAKLFLIEPVSWTRSPMHWPVLGFAVYAFVRYLTGTIGYDGRIELLNLSLAVLVYFVAATTLRRDRDRTVLVLTLALLGFFQAVHGLWQFTSKSNLVFHLDRHFQYQGRASGAFFNPNHLAGFLEIILAVLLAHIVIHWSGARRLQQQTLHKLLQFYCALFVLAGLYATLSRAAWISFGTGVVAFLLWCWYSRDLSPRVVDVALGVVLIVGLVLLSRPSLRQRFADTFTLNPHYTFETSAVEVRDTTAGGRTLMWKSTWQMVRDHPWFGLGPGMWRWIHLAYRDPRLQIRPEYAHNDLLQLGAQYGSVGWLLAATALAFFFTQVACLARQSHSSSERAFALGTATAVTALLVHSLADFNLQIPANALLLATLMGMTIAMGRGNNSRWRSTWPRAAKWTTGLVLIALAWFLGWCGTRTALASRAVQAGNDARAMFHWDIALDHYARALRLDARSPEVYAAIGELYRVRSALADAPSEESDRRRFAREAMDAFRRALLLNPYDSDTLLRLASACELAADLPQARAAYDEALRMDPQNGFAHFRRGLFHYRNNERASALEAFTKAHQLLPADPTINLHLKALSQPE